MGFDSGSGFRRYQYEVENDNSHVFAKHGIESEALSLLEAVTRWREHITETEVGKIR